MKTMERTTKTDRNRRNSESRIVWLCLNVIPSRDGSGPKVSFLCFKNFGGGKGFAVTLTTPYRYKAFRRCQTMARAEGFVRLYCFKNTNTLK